MWLTLSEFQSEDLRGITGSCPGTDDFKLLVNKATRMLMRRGDWADTVVQIRVCVSSGCAVFPRYVGQVRQVNYCGDPTPIASLYKNFVERDYWNRWCGETARVTQGNRMPVFQDMLGDGRLVRAYPRYAVDVGKTIKIFGTDNYNQVLMTNNGDGTFSEGVTITISQPYGSTNVYVRHIDRIVKEVTQGPINVYGYNSDTGLLEDIAQYQPSEINPSYARYNVQMAPTCTGSLLCLVKLQFVPVESDDDPILISNPDALVQMMMSIQSSQGGNIVLGNAQESAAIRELNLQLKDNFPDSQIVIDTGTLGGTGIGRQRIW